MAAAWSNAGTGRGSGWPAEGLGADWPEPFAIGPVFEPPARLGETKEGASELAAGFIGVSISDDPADGCP